MQHAGLPIKDGVLARCTNVSNTVFQALQTGLVSYVELDSVLGLEDALNIIEVDQVAKNNERTIQEISKELSNGK